MILDNYNHNGNPYHGSMYYFMNHSRLIVNGNTNRKLRGVTANLYSTLNTAGLQQLM